jgi:hypothetical protein
VAASVVTHSEATVFARAMWSVMVIKKCGDLRVGKNSNVTAVSAVSAIGASERLEFFSVYRDATVSAVTGAKVNCHLVDKRDHLVHPLYKQIKASRSPP